MEVALILTICLQWIAIVYLAWKHNQAVKVINAHTYFLFHQATKECEKNEWYELAQQLKDKMDGRAS